MLVVDIPVSCFSELIYIDSEIGITTVVCIQILNPFLNVA